jgi:diguanylate cyclase (GGDEF)-like protein
MPLVVVVSIGLTLRVIASATLLSASVATVVAVGCSALGLWLRGRHHSPEWRAAWALLCAALAAQSLLTLHSALVGFQAAYPVRTDWAQVVCALVATTAMGRLLATRARGRAIDVVLEALLLSLATLFLPWVWAISRGTAPAHAAAVLVPVAAWSAALWVLARLVSLSKQHIAGYLYLCGAFICLTGLNAVLAGAALQGLHVNRSDVFGLTLWAYCLWGVAALHPSMSRSFEPAPPRGPGFGLTQLGLCVLAVLVVPASLVLVGDAHGVRDYPEVLTAGALIPVVLAVYLVRQIRDRARAEYRAQHDALTGLPNRMLFNDRLEVALAHARRTQCGVAVMFLDLDRFKSINDSLGHAVGNQLLQAVSKRLRDVVREVDTVARMGGDEFTVLLHGVDNADDAAVVAAKITDQFAIAFNAGGRELYTSTSIGIALFPGDGEDVEALLKHADSAMYRAKASGRNTYEFFTHDMSVQAQARLSVESGLRNALDRHGLELHYQPQIDVNTGQISGLEALARWPHRDVGTVMPNVFVPIAEETGLIVPLGDWAIDRALFDLHRWLDAGITPRPVAVNISARQLSDGALTDKVADALRRHNVPADLLVLEITESVFMRDLPRSTATLRELRELGIGCSIDDFGTGFSGLSYLADMPIDSLKIDRSFVGHIQHAHDDTPIVEAIIGLANGLHLGVIAEGVETEEQIQFLAQHGCAQMQGYYFSQPRPAVDIIQLLERDDRHEIEWLAEPQPSCEKTNETSTLLAALCAGITVDHDDDHITHLLTTLLPPDRVVPTTSALRTASMRIAVGSFAGLIPLSTGLAAAHVLPSPVQSAVATTLRTAGIELPTTTPHNDTTNDTALVAQWQATNSDVGPEVQTTDGSPVLHNPTTAADATGTTNDVGKGDPPSGPRANGNPGNGGTNPGAGTAGNGNPSNGNPDNGGANPGNGTHGKGTPGNRGQNTDHNNRGNGRSAPGDQGGVKGGRRHR